MLKKRRELKNGFYWYKRDGRYAWTVVEINGGHASFLGSDEDHWVEDNPGEYRGPLKLPSVRGLRVG